MGDRIGPIWIDALGSQIGSGSADLARIGGNTGFTQLKMASGWIVFEKLLLLMYIKISIFDWSAFVMLRGYERISYLYVMADLKRAMARSLFMSFHHWTWGLE